MSGFFYWLFYSLPWYLQAAIVLALYAGLLYVAKMIFGWERVRPFALPLLLLPLGIAYAVKLQQSGYADRKAEEDKAVDLAVEDFKDHRQEVDKKPIDQIDKENEKWLKD